MFCTPISQLGHIPIRKETMLTTDSGSSRDSTSPVSPFFPMLNYPNGFLQSSCFSPAMSHQAALFAAHIQQLQAQNASPPSLVSGKKFFTSNLENIFPQSAFSDGRKSPNNSNLADDLMNKFRDKDITVSRIVKDDADSDPMDESFDSAAVDKYDAKPVEMASDNECSPSPSPPLTPVAPGAGCVPNYFAPTSTSPRPQSQEAAVPGTSSSLSRSSIRSEASGLLAKALTATQPRKPRGQKRPIPDALKTKRYYERRSRNNLAAKKSRDQRKFRESYVTHRAMELEAENASLRASVERLKQETVALNLLLTKAE